MGGIIALPSGQFRVQQAVSGFGLRGHDRDIVQVREQWDGKGFPI
jgi:hypothetical protein